MSDAVVLVNWKLREGYANNITIIIITCNNTFCYIGGDRKGYFQTCDFCLLQQIESNLTAVTPKVIARLTGIIQTTWNTILFLFFFCFFFKYDNSFLTLETEGDKNSVYPRSSRVLEILTVSSSADWVCSFQNMFSSVYCPQNNCNHGQVFILSSMSQVVCHALLLFMLSPDLTVVSAGRSLVIGCCST